EWRTTVLVRNLPCYYTQASFTELIDGLGLAGQYDFVYAPIDFKSKRSMGYAFVNPLVCSVVWSQTQGLDANIDVVRRSDMMKKNAAAPEEFKPLVLVQGKLQPLSGLVAEG
ncbi:unnamed protein product, partial [Prorocentrum cordatum]